MKTNFDLDLILKMINEAGKMVKDVVEFYGCSRGQLGTFLRKHNLNFKNNPNARKNQSKLMNGSMNPTKGRKRTDEEMEGVKKAHKKNAIINWDKKFKNGIDYKEYATICRRIIPKELKKETVKFVKEVDHIFSLKDCWRYKIHPYYASCKKNLRVISAEENKQKSDNSLYDIGEFLSIIGAQRLENVQFNWKQVS